jgi:hypothetical protein
MTRKIVGEEPKHGQQKGRRGEMARVYYKAAKSVRTQNRWSRPKSFYRELEGRTSPRQQGAWVGQPRDRPG